MTSKFSICVFCGSRRGSDPAYSAAAKELGRAIAAHDWRLVFGAGDVGLMGDVSNAVTDAGGSTMGVIPEHLLGFEAKNMNSRDAIITDDMHSRKKLMFVNSDAVVVLPGGAGSLDEFFEVLTWAQLGLHKRPIILANINGYWDPLVALIDHVVDQGFADPSLKGFFEVVSTIGETIDRLEASA